MATGPSSSPPSDSNSENSSTQPPTATLSASNNQGFPKDVTKDNGVRDVVKKLPDSVDPFDDFDSTEHIEKFKKYEADYAHRLMAKYFSDKDIYGGDVFDEETTIDGHVIRASRWPGFQSYADPAQFLKDKTSISSTSTTHSPTITSNGKYPIKKEESC